MIESFSRLWDWQVRAGPVLLGVVAFGAINGLRRFYHFHYVPSYFVVFPVSLLDPDVARLAGTGPFEPPSDDQERRKLKRAFLRKCIAAGVLTFVVIPLLLGLTAAFYMTEAELAVTLAVLLVWQGHASYQSTVDNALYARQPVASRSLFTAFYFFYLASLAGFMRQGYLFARPFVLRGDVLGLVGASWDVLFLVVIAASILGILGNLMAYFITERDII